MPNGDLFLLVEVLIKVPSTLAIHLGDDTYESCKRTPCPVSRWKTRTANEILVRDAMYFNLQVEHETIPGAETWPLSNSIAH